MTLNKMANELSARLGKERAERLDAWIGKRILTQFPALSADNIARAVQILVSQDRIRLRTDYNQLIFVLEIDGVAVGRLEFEPVDGILYRDLIPESAAADEILRRFGNSDIKPRRLAND